MRYWLGGLLFGLGLQLPAQAAIDMHSYALRPLTAGNPQPFTELRGQVGLLLLFEPDCGWCVRQTRVLNALQRDCPAFTAAGIGVNASRRSLLQAVQQLRPDFSTYQISRQLLQDLGSVPGTPLMIYLDQQGIFKTYSRGYLPRERLEPLLTGFNPQFCRGL